MITLLFEDLIDLLQKIGAVVMVVLVVLTLTLLLPFLILGELLDKLIMTNIENYFKLKRWFDKYSDRY